MSATPARPVVALSASSGPPWGCPSSRSSGRPMSRASGVRCPGVRASRCPDGQAPVSAALPPRCPRRAGPWSGSVWRAAPGWPQPVDVPGGRRGGVVACRLRPDGKGDGAALAVAGSHEVDRSQGRRLAGVPAAAPPWPQRAGTGAGPGQGAGRGRGAWRGMGGSRCSPAPAGRPGRSRRRGADHGLAQQLVTTLRGRWARVVPWRPAPEGPPGSVGEQPAAVARPRCVRSAVG